MTAQARAPWGPPVPELEKRAEAYIAMRNQATGISLNAQQELRTFVEWCIELDEQQATEKQHDARR
jgi:hypothetical protein